MNLKPKFKHALMIRLLRNVKKHSKDSPASKRIISMQLSTVLKNLQLKWLLLKSFIISMWIKKLKKFNRIKLNMCLIKLHIKNVFFWTLTQTLIISCLQIFLKSKMDFINKCHFNLIGINFKIDIWLFFFCKFYFSFINWNKFINIDTWTIFNCCIKKI